MRSGEISASATLTFSCTEACEYTNSFLHFHPRYSIILDIEAEHLDFFKDINDIRHSFHLFAKNTISDGAIIMNGQIERPEEITEGLSQEVITYGLDPSFTYYAKDITYNEKACGRFSVYKNGEKLGKVAFPYPESTMSTIPSQRSLSRKKWAFP